LRGVRVGVHGALAGALLRVAHRTAVDHVRVARALAGFPELAAAAMGAGRLSYSQVRAISRLARDGGTGWSRI